MPEPTNRPARIDFARIASSRQGRSALAEPLVSRELSPTTPAADPAISDESNPVSHPAKPIVQRVLNPASALDELDLPIELSLGRSLLSAEEIRSVAEGSMIELDHCGDYDVGVYADGQLIAGGRIVVIDGMLSVLISEIVTKSADDLRETPT